MPFKKLKITEAASTDELIGQIERKDRVFRVAQTIFMVSTLVALLIVISAQQRTLNSIQNQVEDAKRVAQAQSDQSDNLQTTILRRLDCLAVYFSQRNRTDLTIEDIDKCTLNRNGTAQQFFTQEPGQQPVTTPTEQPPNLTPAPIQ